MGVGDPTPPGQTTGHVAGTGSKFIFNFTQSLDYNGKNYLADYPNCKECCWMAFCFWNPFGKYTSDTNTLFIKNQCLCCCQDWKAEIVQPDQERGSGKILGGTSAPTCCENGLVFCCCPMCACSGNAVLQKFYHKEPANVFYTFRQRLFPCWCCLACCGSCGTCIQCCGDCCAFCNNQNYVVTVERLFPDTGKIDLKEDLNSHEGVGRIILADRIDCLGCFPFRTPVRYASLLEEGAEDDDMVPVLGIMLAIFSGLPVPCKCCTRPPVPAPTGVSCIDAGRRVTSARMDMQGMMKLTETTTPAALIAAIDAQVTTTG